MVDHATHVIPKVAEYFGDERPIPTVAEAWHDKRRRWEKAAWRKRVSRSWLRKMQQEGYTHVALAHHSGRVADFSIRELLA